MNRVYLSVIWRILDGMNSGDHWRLGRRPALDGLRGVAILLVLIGHAWQPLLAFGSAGVTLFFVLSGFLITALLLEERARAGANSWRRFYARRARRLFPALALFLIVMLTAGFTVSPFFGTPKLAALVGLYVANWFTAGGHPAGALGHTWSLSVEEQFYLVWPLALAGLLTFGRRRAAVVVTALGLLASVVARLILWDGGAGSYRVYSGSDTNAAPLLAGCLLALLMHGRRDGQARPRAAAVVIIVAAVVATVPGELNIRMMTPLLMIPLATLALIFVGRGVCTGWVAAPALRYVGQRSYALYLWHYPLLATANELHLSLWWTPALVVLSFLLAEASWRLVEQPVLTGQLSRKKSKYASTPPPVDSSVAARPMLATENGTV